MNADQNSSAAVLIGFVVMSVAVVGYFTGLQAPMKVTPADSHSAGVKQPTDSGTATAEGVILATYYSEMSARKIAPYLRSAGYSIVAKPGNRAIYAPTV